MSLGLWTRSVIMNSSVATDRELTMQLENEHRSEQHNINVRQDEFNNQEEQIQVGQLPRSRAPS
jgi:hypothetical protein